MNGKIQVKRTVHRNGKTFQQMYWVNPKDVKPTDQVLPGQQSMFDQSAKAEEAKPKAVSPDDLSNIRKSKGADEAMKAAKAAGISWKESDKPGINWMRCMMAAKKAAGNVQNAPEQSGKGKPKGEKKTPEKTQETAGNDESGGIDQQLIDQVNAAGDKKQKIALMLNKLGREGVMKWAAAQGIQWNMNANPGINWMRASMAVQKHLSSNPLSAAAPEPETAPEPEQPKEQAQPETAPEPETPSKPEQPKKSKPKSPKAQADPLVEQFNKAAKHQTVEESHEHLKGMLADVISTFDGDDFESIDWYSSEAYLPVNAMLRSTKGGYPHDKAGIQNLYEETGAEVPDLMDETMDSESFADMLMHFDKVTTSMSMPEDTVVYRGVNADAIQGLLGLPASFNVKDPKKLKSLIGKVGVDNGFMSCTPTASHGFVDTIDLYDTQFQILCPRGTKCGYIAPMNEFFVGESMSPELVSQSLEGDYSEATDEITLPRGCTLQVIDASVKNGKVTMKLAIVGQNTAANTETETPSSQESGNDFKTLNTVKSKREFASTYDTWESSLSKPEHAAVRKYVMAHSINFNQYLRTGEKTWGEQATRAEYKALDSAIEKSSIPESVVLYRGAPEIFFGGKNPKSLIGKTISDKGYVSTSMSDHVAKVYSEGVICKIRCRAGSKGCYIDKIGFGEPTDFSNDHNNEIVLPRNSRFKVLSVEKRGKNWEVELNYED